MGHLQSEEIYRRHGRSPQQKAQRRLRRMEYGSLAEQTNYPSNYSQSQKSDGLGGHTRRNPNTRELCRARKTQLPLPLVGPRDSISLPLSNLLNLPHPRI